jgi:DNA polymerase
VKPKVVINKFGSESISYEGIGDQKKWARLESYGPKFVENIVQATARDLLCYAMRNLKDYRIVMHVHDEVIIEDFDGVSHAFMEKEMAKIPEWASGLILRADGYECPFYQKD